MDRWHGVEARQVAKTKSFDEMRGRRFGRHGRSCVLSPVTLKAQREAFSTQIHYMLEHMCSTRSNVSLCRLNEPTADPTPCRRRAVSGGNSQEGFALKGDVGNGNGTLMS